MLRPAGCRRQAQLLRGTVGADSNQVVLEFEVLPTLDLNVGVPAAIQSRWPDDATDACELGVVLHGAAVG